MVYVSSVGLNIPYDNEKMINVWYNNDNAYIHLN